jgi:hypothetical protein
MPQWRTPAIFRRTLRALCIAKQNSRRPPSSAALRLARASASSIASGRTIAIEAAMGATR